MNKYLFFLLRRITSGAYEILYNLAVFRVNELSLVCDRLKNIEYCFFGDIQTMQNAILSVKIEFWYILEVF